jgi:hypothetical protein
MKLDGEQFFKQFMVVLLTLHPKTCYLSPYLLSR